MLTSDRGRISRHAYHTGRTVKLRSPLLAIRFPILLGKCTPSTNIATKREKDSINHRICHPFAPPVRVGGRPHKNEAKQEYSNEETFHENKSESKFHIPGSVYMIRYQNTMQQLTKKKKTKTKTKTNSQALYFIPSFKEKKNIYTQTLERSKRLGNNPIFIAHRDLKLRSPFWKN